MKSRERSSSYEVIRLMKPLGIFLRGCGTNFCCCKIKGIVLRRRAIFTSSSIPVKRKLTSVCGERDYRSGFPPSEHVRTTGRMTVLSRSFVSNNGSAGVNILLRSSSIAALFAVCSRRAADYLQTFSIRSRGKSPRLPTFCIMLKWNV